MKQSLLVFILLMFAFSMQAQMVLIRDSMPNIYTGGFPLPANVTDYSYDSSCRLSTETSRSSQSVYTYYPDGNLYQSRYLLYSYNPTDSIFVWKNNDRQTFTYNAAGKTISRIVEQTNGISDTFNYVYEDSFAYDNNDYKVKSYYLDWDKSLHIWTIISDTSFYYGNGRLDSSIFTPSIYGSGGKNVYTYYTNSNKLYQVTTYMSATQAYDESAVRTTFFYDSSSYVETDSAIAQVIDVQADTVRYVSYSSRHTAYYDSDNLKTEDEGFFYAFESGHSKTFYFYAPCPSILPVTLLNFSAERQNNNALLHWQTANETNTSSFQILRSTDGEHFTTVGSVAASGNSSLNKSYTYTDANAFLLTVPKLYYRLAETDQNGVVNFSKTITLDITAGKLFVYISPNPVVNTINVFATATLNSAIITVTDMKGRIVYNASQTMGAGSKISIDASGFAKGMYIVTIRSAASKQQLKIVKE